MTVLVVSKVLGDKGYDGYGGYVYMVETTILVINFEIFCGDLCWNSVIFGHLELNLVILDDKDN